MIDELERLPSWPSKAHPHLEIGSGDPAISVEFHTGHTTDDAPNYFRKEWEDYLPDIIPIGLTLTVRRWKNRSGGAPIRIISDWKTAFDVDGQISIKGRAVK